MNKNFLRQLQGLRLTCNSIISALPELEAAGKADLTKAEFDAEIKRIEMEFGLADLVA